MTISIDPLESLFSPAISIKIVEVAKKYDQPEGTPIISVPEYTEPGGPNSYVCTPNEKSWTQGFFAGLIWTLVERLRLLPKAVNPEYTEEQLLKLARRWQDSFRHLARPALNHDQGFRFQLSYGYDYTFTGSEEAKTVLIEAADSLVDRFNPKVGLIRSWDAMKHQEGRPRYDLTNMDEHFLVIIDNMMNLDLMFLATELTGDEKYKEIAISQAEKSSKTHIRPDFTTNHVVNFDPVTGEKLAEYTHQGWSDQSCWARGQAWAMYGYAQCHLRTGRADFLEIAENLTKVFLDNLSPSGVPWWDFSAPQPRPYDASAGCIAARALQMLYRAHLSSDPKKAREYLTTSKKLMASIIQECYTPEASLKNGKVDFGPGGWETVLQHSTIAGNPNLDWEKMDHGLVYADYYMMEYGNELLKMQKEGLAV